MRWVTVLLFGLHIDLALQGCRATLPLVQLLVTLIVVDVAVRLKSLRVLRMRLNQLSSLRRVVFLR